MQTLKGLRGYILLSLGWLVILAGVLWFNRQPSGQAIEILPPPTFTPSPPPVATPTPSPLRVDVAGAVRTPGVYTLPPGSIVADALAAAGGPAGDADPDRVNKAVALQDGMQVYVPRMTQAGPTPLPLSTAAATVSTAAKSGVIAVGGLVNLNTATLDELESLPGIGPAFAQKIVEGRPYGTVEDLLRVKGIGPATLDKLKDRVTVR